jgi:putative phosphoribosyl transferase
MTTHIEHLASAVPAGGVTLDADTFLPENAAGLVIFAHGSGSSRHSPRNRHVSELLNTGGLATMLVDLLTLAEEASDRHTGDFRFDVAMLGSRLREITEWVGEQTPLRDLKRGYFGASTGAAAALIAASARPDLARAIVSRGGRPDLAGTALKAVLTPTLFIVGSADPQVLQLNREAMAMLPDETESKLAIIPHATHLFEEPGTLDQAASLARDWFRKHLG